MAWSGREDFPNIREWSGSPSGSPGVVGMTSRMSGSVRDVLPEVRE